MEHMAPKAFPSARVATIGLAWFVLIVSLGIQARPSAQQPAPQVKSAQSSSPIGAVSPASSHRGTLDRYCVTCHNQRLATAGLKLDEADVANPGEGAEIWEKVVRKLRTGMMPPPNMPQPSMEDRRALLSWLETSLDKAAAAKPNPGRTETLRRLNRTEYQNAIRDLLSVDIDAASLLPADESGHGFDNVTVGDLPPALLDRYISAAQKISALAIGSTQTSLQSDIIRVPPDVTQEGDVVWTPCRHARRGSHSLYVRAERRIRHPDLPRAWLFRGCRRVEGPAAPRDQVVARPDADWRVHCPETRQRRRLAHRQESENSRARDGRSASARRHVCEEFLFTDRNSAPAPPVAVQRETSSAHHSGDFPGLRHRTIRAAGCGRYAEPPPDIRLPARLAKGSGETGRQRPKRQRARAGFCPRSCGARTVGRFPRRIWNGRWRSIAKESQNATSMRE